MSSILDALKKSEAERQRGVPPTLDSPAAFHRTRPAPRRSSRLWLPALAVLAAVVAWGTGMFDFGTGSLVTPDTGVEGPEMAPADSSVASIAGGADAPIEAADSKPELDSGTTGEGDTAVVPADASTTPADASPPARRIGFGPRPSAIAPAPNAADPVESTPASQPAPRAAAATPAPVDVPAAPPSTASPEAAPATAPPSTAGAPSAAPPASAAPNTPAPTPAAGRTAQTPKATEPTPVTAAPAVTGAPAAGTVPTIYELPFAARRALPEVAVTMHMYSADPERRFALVNGIRVRDGMSLEGGIEIVRILPDGVQLRFEDTEFVLPVGN